MHLRTSARTAILVLITSSAPALAGEPSPSDAGLQLTSRVAETSGHVELELRGGAAGGSAWLVGVDRPRDLVAFRARLEGFGGAAPLSGEHDLVRVDLDASGSWTRSVDPRALRGWFQAFTLDPHDGFEFSDLTRGARDRAGSFSAAGEFQHGLVVVTEFMKDPAQVSDTAGEWIELQNVAGHRIDLEGCVLGDDGSNAHLIFAGGQGLWFLPRRKVVLGRDADPTANGGIALDYEYSGFTLGNGADQIEVRGPNDRLLDRVEYDDGVAWPDTSGMSIQLTPGAEDPFLNDDGANWCHSTSLVASGSTDTGTPSAANDVCP